MLARRWLLAFSAAFVLSVAAAGEPSAVRPEGKLQVGWWKEHFERNLDWAKRYRFDFVFIGDSIMNRWEYEPAGMRVWPEKLAKYRILNCGLAADRTENVLWRLDHGEIDGADPLVVFVHIGTNNSGQRKDSPEDTAAGIRAIVGKVREKAPRAKIVLHPIFLRGERPDDPVRALNERVNELIRPLADGERVVWMDLRPLFSNPDGTLSAKDMKDFLHLTSDDAYRRWADAIVPVMDEALATGRAAPPRIRRLEGAKAVGRTLSPWNEGLLDLHFIQTGTGENLFWILPDGTTVLCDTGDYNHPPYRKDVPLMPSGERTGGEWVARYLKAVSPDKDRIDYMMITHWHSDHGGELKSAYVTPDGRKTSGLATVGEFFKVGTFFDHQYPECNRLGVGEGHVAKMVREYVARAAAKDGTVQEPFRVGALNQIALRHDPKGRYAGAFGIRNICANGKVWTGEGEKTEDLLSVNLAHGAKARRINENLLSIGVVVRYGKFRYYSGGDVSGGLLDAQGRTFSYEARVGAAAGRVDVAKANHHAWKDAMVPGFVKAVEPAAYVINLWAPEQILDVQMSTMASRALYPGERFVFATHVPECARTAFSDKPWWRDLCPEAGHVVVRVPAGGEVYRIYVLDARDEMRTVRAVYEGRSGGSDDGR